MFHYAIALGSNRRHGRHGAPKRVVEAAIAALGKDVAVVALSPIMTTRAVGDRGRQFANAAILVETALAPAALLARLKAIERAFGRRRGKRWGARVLDLDLLLWSGGRWRTRRPALVIPHPALAERRFVLDPLVRIAPEWPIPPLAIHVRQAHARLTRPRPLP